MAECKKLSPEELANTDGGVLIARRAAAVKYEDLSEAEVLMTKKAILDTLGCIIGGSGLGNRCTDFVEMANETGGKPEATILGWGGKYPALYAAAANGGMAHTLDFDDTIPETGHQSAGTLPATLAAIEYMGGATGKELITAMACGADMVCRLHKCCPTSTAMGWVGTATTGIFGGAVGAAKAMGLDEDGIAHAIGWALWQASFSGQVLNETGSDAREVYAAFSQSYGFLSALLAKRGMKSCVNSIEGKDGLFNKYYRPFDSVDPQYIKVQPGDVFEGVNGQIKPWCSCGQTHGYIQAVKSLMAEYGFKADDVKEVFVKVGDLGKKLSESYEARYVPKKANDARFSIPYTLACTLLDGDVTLGCFLPENLEKHYETAAKVKWEYDEATANDPNCKGLEPAYVKITLNDGTVYEKTVTFPYGHPKNPMTMEDICNKFRDCCSYSKKKMSSEDVEKVIELCLNLENVEDVSEIIALVS